MPVTSPYSIRLSPEQRDFIRAQAKAMLVREAAWIRGRLFHGSAETATHFTSAADLKLVAPKSSNNKELAQILYMLGQSRIANNLNQIAKAVNMGTLIISPDVYAQIDEAYRMVTWMREALIKAQGLKP